mgnify:CR=1 FL=1
MRNGQASSKQKGTDVSRETSGDAAATPKRADAVAPVADLHVHTTLSDGSDTFEEVLAQARERGIGRVAFTNHDTTRGLDGAVVLGERFVRPHSRIPSLFFLTFCPAP